MEFIDLKAQYRALQPDMDAAVAEVLRHGQYIMGPEVAQMEAALCERLGVRHTVSVSSGTEALLISLMALGVGRGDEVITTPFTFAATVEVIALLGAVPVFVDIEPGSCLMDPQRVGAAVSERTRAVIPVSLYGQMADLPAIERAVGPDIPVIEDAAQSFGATLDTPQGRLHSGHASAVGCTSFFPSKPLGCYGDGGAIFTDRDDWAQAMREIRVHGQSARYVHTRVGVGGRMDTLQCAVILTKLRRFEAELQARDRLGARYNAALQTAIDAGDAPGLCLLEVHPGRRCVWGQYTVRVQDRDALVDALKAQGIPTAVHYPHPLHQQAAYAEHRVVGSLRHAEAAARSVLSLPMGPDLLPEDQDRVVAALLQALQSRHGARAGAGA